MQNLVKLQIITDHQDYKKGQIIELDEKAAISLLTNGKALRIHRKKEEASTEDKKEKDNKKSK